MLHSNYLRIEYLAKSICIYALIFCGSSFAQNFTKIQDIAKLGALKENNGVAVADYDGDNDLDLFVVAKARDIPNNPTTQSKLYRNNGNGTFKDVTVESGLINLFPENEEGLITDALDGYKYGAFWGDYDNDGFPDLFFTHSYKVQLFRNLGDGTFLNITAAAGITSKNNCINTGATWFDANNDGFLDIYVSVWGGCNGNILYLNNGNNTFTDVSESYNVNSFEQSYMSVPFDLNSDGWMDLFVTNDLIIPNQVFINQGGNGFIETTNYPNLNTSGNEMGIAIGDYNNDGSYDMFVTNIDENLLLTNRGDNTFENDANNTNVLNTGWAWDVTFSDFDLDGDEDLFITNGFKISVPNKQSNIYFKNLLNEGSSSFEDITNALMLNEETVSVGATPFDYDNDGDLDLFVSNSDGPSFFYENDILNNSSNNSKHWFKVILEGTVSNRSAIGTAVSITTNLGVINRYYTGLGFLSQSAQPVHFGLANASNIIEIKIKWPSGIEEIYNNLPLDSTIRIKENEGYEVLDIPKAVKIIGCTDATSCNYNPLATIDDDSCVYITSGTIEGEETPNVLSTKTYRYNGISQSNNYEWHVVGGEIINGFNTNTVTVKWGVKENGEISVKEISTECSSKETLLQINLKASGVSKDYSVARLWNEALLNAIRADFARPTVHARNLFHTSIAMYDAWAIYNNKAKPYLLGNTVHGFTSAFNGFDPEETIEIARNKTISYAAYRLLTHRFAKSPGVETSQRLFNHLMREFGYDMSFDSIDFSNGNAAALGNYIAKTIIDYGLMDGSREQFDYNNSYYRPINFPMLPKSPGNSDLEYPNRWQPLSLNEFIDQSGNVIPGVSIPFLSPEWGNVHPFSLNDEVKTNQTRDGNNYNVFHDPLPPPYLNLNTEDASSKAYKWGFSMVSVWGSHLDPTDNVLLDISPKSIGNIDISNFPKNYEGYPDFYKLLEGGDIGLGHNTNPITNAPYQEQRVPRGDYTRVLAEFWADGPDSETPPGHWFTLLNYVSDHELFEKKLEGKGETLNALEWDVKSYFLLGGAMHDAAISAWSIKGWYDYIRPISAIRYMCQLGQSTDNTLDNYHVAGIGLIDGYIEVVKTGDPLAGSEEQHVGKIKLYTWRGHKFINNVETDAAGVGWILAENWWPYQRPSFVTPPFAGFVSGHSTYSRAAAEIMTLLTGNPFFPGGYGEFIARKNEFLVFEEGPSVDVKLQWATYRDASDQCSLSRIWGGIHPPADDIPGRFIGEKIGIDAFGFGIKYFSGKKLKSNKTAQILYPNPLNSNSALYVSNTLQSDVFKLVDIRGSQINILSLEYNEISKITQIHLPQNLSSGVYILRINNISKLIVKQ